MNDNHLVPVTVLTGFGSGVTRSAHEPAPKPAGIWV